MAKVILTHEVSGLGTPGDVVEVKNGYARNYLVPQGFATPWTRGGEKQVEQIKAARAAREMHSLEDAQALKAKLESGKVRLAVKAGLGGRLFGSVKVSDVAAAVAAAGLGDVDKRKIQITTPIKAVGDHEATIRLTTSSRRRSPSRWSRRSNSLSTRRRRSEPRFRPPFRHPCAANAAPRSGRGASRSMTPLGVSRGR